jgi:hypothetical protein
MKFVQSLLALALAGALGSAYAVGPSYVGNLSGTSVSVGNSFAPSSVINDVYTFDILPLSSVAGTAVTINLDIPLFAGTEFAISNFGVEFRDGLGNLITSDFQTSPTDYTVEISANLPAATGYKFIVLGNVTGTLGGSYGGALAAAPVPEAETYAMMLAGLGLVGFTVSRRRGSF